VSKVFLLSPAHSAGKRAEFLLRGQFELAAQLRSPEGCALSDAYVFMSSLYFRGKLAYCRKYGEQGFIITPGYGLVSLRWRLNLERFARIKATELSLKTPDYVEPFKRDVEKLALELPNAQFILLGSIATPKYVDVLKPALPNRLFYPTLFKGRGDMSRGALMLESCRNESELDYSPIV
jgi:hypothetical protein